MGVPFGRGVKGGLPKAFDNADHGLQNPCVKGFEGVAFGSFSDDAPLYDLSGRTT